MFIVLRLTQAIPFVAAVAVVVWIMWMRRNPRIWRFGVAPISWAVNVFLLSVSSVAASSLNVPLPPSLWRTWIIFVILHGLFLTIGAGLVGIWWYFLFKNGGTHRGGE